MIEEFGRTAASGDKRAEYTCDAACIGELVIDLVPAGTADGQNLFAACPGGAVGNVAAGIARLGGKSLMLSRVGDDAFGRLLIRTLDGLGVGTSGIQRSGTERTPLSVVTLSERGERSFTFYHENAADLHIDPHGISEPAVRGARLLHAGTLALSAPQSAAAQRRAMDIADAARRPISCDLNFRPALWPDPAQMIEAGRFLISRSTFVKVSEEELSLLAGNGSMDAAVQSLWHERLRLFSVTRGAQGAALSSPQSKTECAGFAVDAVDTTGAGDAFAAALLSGVLEGLDETRLPQLLLSACAAGALATMKKGAMDSLPSRSDIAQLLGQQKARVSSVPRIQD